MPIIWFRRKVKIKNYVLNYFDCGYFRIKIEDTISKFTKYLLNERRKCYGFKFS